VIGVRPFFTNLRPGKYTFRVRACNCSGQWNEVGASISIKQQAFFFQQGWFIFLVVLGAVLLGISMHHFQIYRIERRKRHLEKQVNQRTQILLDVNQQLRTTQEQVVEAARRAGMAEITSNVLGEVESYSREIQDRAESLRKIIEEIQSPEKIRELVSLIREREKSLESFLDRDPKGLALREELVAAIVELPSHGRKLRSRTDGIKRVIAQLTEIITAQQKYAKLEGTVDLVDINLLIVDAIKFCKQNLNANGISVMKDLKPIPRFEGQKSNILKVLVSLVQRSCFMMSENPVHKYRHLSIATKSDSGIIAITFDDTGNGVPQEETPSTQASSAADADDHHGFTLQACRSLIQEMKGTLVVENEVGVGTTFTLNIPFPESSNG